MVRAGDLWCLKGDLHIHSHHSDGERLEKMISRVINCGFDFCAISDHDTFAGSRAALKLAEECKENFPFIIRSQESTCSGCHILSYGTLEEYVKSAPLDEVCRNIRAAGGYAVAAHPDWVHTRSFFRESGLFRQLVESEALDGIELMNFPMPEDKGRIAEEWTNSFYFEYSSHFAPPAVTCGSDAHCAHEITPERYLAVFAERPDEKSVLEAIFRHKRAVAVWGECVIGTPEACELYFSIPQHQSFRKLAVSREICADGMRLKVSGGGKNCFSGCLEQISDDTFFKSGFDHGEALIINRNGGEMSAEYLEFPDKVDIRCIPVFEDGAIRARFETGSQERLVLKCSVNGKEFISEKSVFTCGEVEEMANDIAVLAYDSSGTAVCRKRWDFPVCVLEKWYDLSLLFAETPAPDGIEPSARFRFSCAADDIVLDMEVDDALFCQPYRGFGMYMGDSVQFGLDFDCAASENDLVERRIWEFGICVTDDGTCDFAVYNFPAAADRSLAEKLRYSAIRQGSRSIYQVVIGREFSGTAGAAGFNMIFNINDGAGRRGYLAWRKGIGDRKKSADWGYILFTDSIVPNVVKEV